MQPVNKALANPLTPHFSNLACALLINAQRTDEDDLSSNFVHSSYAALIALVKHSCASSTETIKLLLILFLEMLEKTVSLPSLDLSRNKDT